jgi:hypothetical protein
MDRMTSSPRVFGGDPQGAESITGVVDASHKHAGMTIILLHLLFTIMKKPRFGYRILPDMLG